MSLDTDNPMIMMERQATEVQARRVKDLEKFDAEKGRISNEAIGQMLLSLIQNNDNSQNPFDDCFYIKNLLKSMGNLICFKNLEEIIQEIHRQFKLDLIQKSQGFAILKGTIAAWYRIKKNLWTFQHYTQNKLELPLNQQTQIEQALVAIKARFDLFEADVLKLQNQPGINLDIQGFIFSKKIKFDFFCKYPFMSALYHNIQEIFELMKKSKVREATYFTKIFADFIEEKMIKKNLDYRFLHIDREQQKIVVECFWKMMTNYLHNYKDGALLFHLRRLYFFFFFEDVPQVYRRETFRQQQMPKFDDCWKQSEEALFNQFERDQEKASKQMAAQGNAVSFPTNFGAQSENFFAGHNKVKIDKKFLGQAGGFDLKIKTYEPAYHEGQPYPLENDDDDYVEMPYELNAPDMKW